MNTLHKQYSQATGSEYGLRLTMDLKEINDGYQIYKMYRGSSEVAYCILKLSQARSLRVGVEL
jgi:hypothetical protein